MKKRISDFCNQAWKKICDNQMVAFCALGGFIVIIGSFVVISSAANTTSRYSHVERFSTTLGKTSTSSNMSASNETSVEDYLASLDINTTPAATEINDNNTSLQTPSTDNPDLSNETIADIAGDNILAVETSIGTAERIVLPHDEFGNVIESDDLTMENEDENMDDMDAENPDELDEMATEEATEETNEDPDSPVGTFRVKSDVNLLNMRETPDSNATIVAKLTSVSRGTVISYDKNWAHVKTTNYEGYVATQFIIITDN